MVSKVIASNSHCDLCQPQSILSSCRMIAEHPLQPSTDGIRTTRSFLFLNSLCERRLETSALYHDRRIHPRLQERSTKFQQIFHTKDSGISHVLRNVCIAAGTVAFVSLPRPQTIVVLYSSLRTSGLYDFLLICSR